jgi:hypothetical protein
LYTINAREIAAVSFWFQLRAPLNGVIRFVYLRLLALIVLRNVSRLMAFHFGKSKSVMLKIVSSDSPLRWTRSLRFWKQWACLRFQVRANSVSIR